MGKKSYKVGAVSSLLEDETKPAFDKKLLDIFGNKPVVDPSLTAVEAKPKSPKKKKPVKQESAEAGVVGDKNASKKNKKAKKQQKSPKSPEAVDAVVQKPETVKGAKKKKAKRIANGASADVDNQDQTKKVPTTEKTKRKKKSKKVKAKKTALGVENSVNLDHMEAEDILANENPDGLDEDSDLDERVRLNKEDKPDKPALTNLQRNTPKEKNSELEARTVFVGNLPPDYQKKQIFKLFRDCGKVETVRIRCGTAVKPYLLKKVAVNQKKLNPNQKSINAYVRFASVEEAFKASQELNGSEVEKHHLVVDLASAGKKDRKRAIFVGNIHLKTSDDELRTVFEDCGEIESVRVVRDRDSGLSKGFGYVNFKEAVSIPIALKKNGEVLHGRDLRVMKVVKKLKQPKEERNKDHKSAPVKKPFSKLFSKKDQRPKSKFAQQSPAQRRLEMKARKNGFAGDEMLRKKPKKGQHKPNKLALKKASIASQLTGISKTKLKETFAKQKKNRD